MDPLPHHTCSMRHWGKHIPSRSALWVHSHPTLPHPSIYHRLSILNHLNVRIPDLGLRFGGNSSCGSEADVTGSNSVDQSFVDDIGSKPLPTVKQTLDFHLPFASCSNIAIRKLSERWDCELDWTICVSRSLPFYNFNSTLVSNTLVNKINTNPLLQCWEIQRRGNKISHYQGSSHTVELPLDIADECWVVWSRFPRDKRIWKRIDTCICITESLCCIPETNTILLINYMPI